MPLNLKQVRDLHFHFCYPHLVDWLNLYLACAQYLILGSSLEQPGVVHC